MIKDHSQENKIWRLVKNLSIILIIVAMLLFSILVVSGKITKLNESEYICTIFNNHSWWNIGIDQQTPVKSFYVKNLIEAKEFNKTYFEGYTFNITASYYYSCIEYTPPIEQEKVAIFSVCKTGNGDCEVLRFDYKTGEEEKINELEKQLKIDYKFVIRGKDEN